MRLLATFIVTLVLTAGGAASAQPAPGAGHALRFFGQGVAAPDRDRVKIRIDDPATTLPGPPADIGAADFTIEFWLRGAAAENTAGPIACGANYNWITGNIVFDRDRYNQPRAFGVSLGAGRVAFGVIGDGGASRTICGVTDVLDGAWHHVAVQRRRSDGRLWLYVDGRLEADAAGPAGDVSYPDDGVPGPYCGGPCTNSDPFIVLGAEKHDAGTAYPSFAGWLDELRLSSRLRYGTSFVRPATPFTPDADTAALYHFDEGQGDLVADTSGAAGGPSPGVRRVGGALQGPQWVVSDAPLGGASPLPLTVVVDRASYRGGERLSLTVRATGGLVAGEVDAYVVVQVPDGGVMSLQLDGRLVPGLVPLARHAVVPTATVPFVFIVPPGTPPGGYAWLAGLTRPSTVNLVSALSRAAFQVTP